MMAACDGGLWCGLNSLLATPHSVCSVMTRSMYTQYAQYTVVMLCLPLRRALHLPACISLVDSPILPGGHGGGGRTGRC